ncbi:MAG: radical SAM protein [Deltaproteobacteria bacterium]|nr:radical SAM protein [Deltaproteobacteria bacterium]
MKFRLIYPKWEKLEGQTTFNLPPHGPVVMAATLPEDVEVEFIDENVSDHVIDDEVDLVGVSMMLTTQVKRGWAVADKYRALGRKVIFGGISTMLHAEETLEHADSIFLGETEGRMEEVFADLKAGRLKKVYNYMGRPPAIELVGPARREILDKDRYYYKGVRMVDLFHASRGCQFDCYPCAVAYLGGRSFRPRPIDKAIEELAGIDNNRLFVVDNSLAQDHQWEMDLFREMIPLKKNWCSHTIEDDPEVLDLAARAGAWYVYQAVFDRSDYIRDRIKRYHDHGIAVEGTILLGMENHTEDFIKELIDFLLEIDLDLAEFTVLVPFPHTKAHDDLMKQDRIFDLDWDHYNAGRVVYHPKHMSAERLQELYHYAWDTFYADETQQFKFYKLLQRVVDRERKAGTYQGRRRDLMKKSFGKDILKDVMGDKRGDDGVA